jgi:hypothetical protein
MCHEVLEPLFASSASAFRWTYSTFEATDTDEHPLEPGTPRVVFLPELPPAGETRRNRVFLTDRPAHDSSWHLAQSIVDCYLADPGRWSALVEHRVGKELDLYRRLDSFRNGSSRAGTTMTSVAQPDPVRPELDRRSADRDQRFEGEERATRWSAVVHQQRDYSSCDLEQVLGRLEEEGVAPEERRALTARVREIVAKPREPAPCGVAAQLREMEHRLWLLALIVVTVLLLADIIF